MEMMHEVAENMSVRERANAGEAFERMNTENNMRIVDGDCINNEMSYREYLNSRPGSRVSFGSSVYSAESELKKAERDYVAAAERHVKEGNNLIATENRAKEVKEAAEKLEEAKRQAEVEKAAKKV